MYAKAAGSLKKSSAYLAITGRGVLSFRDTYPVIRFPYLKSRTKVVILPTIAVKMFKEVNSFCKKVAQIFQK